jgi:hypothetical protein
MRSAEPNEQTNFPFAFPEKSVDMVATKDEAKPEDRIKTDRREKTRNFWLERIPAPGENRTTHGYFRAVPELGKHPRGFVASLFRVFRFSALDVHSHVEILT